MADPADIANDYADEFLQRALNARSQAAAQVQAGSLECEDCDAVIPQERRDRFARPVLIVSRYGSARHEQSIDSL